jgi:hypothetical protein
VPLPFPPHVAKNVRESRRLYDLVQDRGLHGAEAIVQGEHALAKLSHGDVGGVTLEEIYDRPGSFARPYLPDDETPTGYGDAKPGPGEDEVESNP